MYVDVQPTNTRSVVVAHVLVGSPVSVAAVRRVALLIKVKPCPHWLLQPSRCNPSVG
eukprot:m.191647 g.191647  ORF g.191647 m.191647 type:complete len:57 (-) comp32440_c1_seq1:1238-1408(-)